MFKRWLSLPIIWSLCWSFPVLPKIRAFRRYSLSNFLNAFSFNVSVSSSKSFSAADNCFLISFLDISVHLSSHKLSASCALELCGKFTMMKFNKFATLNGLFAGKTRVSLLPKFGWVLEFRSAGKKRTVGTDKAVNCHGKSFSAASMVTKLMSFLQSCVWRFLEFALKH